MTPNVLIVHPDLAVASKLKQLILRSGIAEVGYESYLEDGLIALRDYSHLDLCLFDLTYPDGDGSTLLAAVMEKFPRARRVAVTAHPLEEYAELDPTVVLFPLPLDETRFIFVCRESLESLEGHELSHFQLGQRLRSDRWSDWYEAFDTLLKRQVYISVVHSWAPPEEVAHFRSTAVLRAQATHNHIHSVYMGGEFHGRSFVCHEKRDIPSLAELAARGQKIDARMAAQILHTVGSVLIFWDSHRYPHLPLDANSVSLSPNGAVKIENCVDPALPFKVLEMTDLRLIADTVHALLSPLEQIPTPLRKLLNKLRANEQVVLETSLGAMIVELYRTAAPLTVANFLAYVDRQAYDGTLFHHIISGFIVQGGRFDQTMNKIPTDPPIPSEASNGLLNLCGTLAMARHKDPDSATSQFIFNLVDNASLDGGPAGPGYTVFGKIVQGMEAIDRMAQVEVNRREAYFFPVNPVVLVRARRKISLTVADLLLEIQRLDKSVGLKTTKEAALMPPMEEPSSRIFKAISSASKTTASIAKAILKLR